MTYSTYNVLDMSQQVVVTVLQFEILASYIEEDIFKLAGGIIPKGIYQNFSWSFDIQKKYSVLLN